MATMNKNGLKWYHRFTRDDKTGKHSDTKTRTWVCLAPAIVYAIGVVAKSLLGVDTEDNTTDVLYALIALAGVGAGSYAVKRYTEK